MLPFLSSIWITYTSFPLQIGHSWVIGPLQLGVRTPLGSKKSIMHHKKRQTLHCLQKLGLGINITKIRDNLTILKDSIWILITHWFTFEWTWQIQGGSSNNL